MVWSPILTVTISSKLKGLRKLHWHIRMSDVWPRSMSSKSKQIRSTSPLLLIQRWWTRLSLWRMVCERREPLRVLFLLWRQKRLRMFQLPASIRLCRDRVQVCRSSPLRVSQARLPLSRFVVPTPLILARLLSLFWTVCLSPAPTSIPWVLTTSRVSRYWKTPLLPLSMVPVRQMVWWWLHLREVWRWTRRRLRSAHSMVFLNWLRTTGRWWTPTSVFCLKRK